MYNIDAITTNLNYLSPIGFKLEIDRLPHVTFLAQKCDLPDINMYTVDVPTPILDYPIPGNKLEYSPLKISFIVDENMANYIEIIEWMYGLNNPESLDNHKLYQTKNLFKQFHQNRSTFLDLFSDAYLHILDSNNRENTLIKFIDIFPVEISDIKLGTNMNDILYITCDVMFDYSYFEINTI